MTSSVIAVGDVEVRCVEVDSDAPRDDDEAVDVLWAQALVRGRHLFDGLVLCLSEVQTHAGGAVVVGRFERYRRVFAHLSRPELCPGLRPVGVSSVTQVAGGVLVGRRAPDVTEYPGRLELAPTGSIDPTNASEGRVDWRAALVRELREEVGVTIAPGAVRGFGLVHDADHDVYDIIGGIDLDHVPLAATAEYSWLGVAQPNGDLMRDLVPTSKLALQLALG